MMNDYDLYGEIIRIVKEQTIYLRHYYGQVIDNNDSLKKGRVKSTIPGLGLISKDLSIWCNARQGHSMSVPKIGAWVEVYFMHGDPELPVYLHLASNVANNTPTSYTGDVDKHILFQDPNKSAGNVIYNSNGEILTFLEGDESFVLGDTAKTELDKDEDAMTTLQAAINGWIPLAGDGGGALKTALGTFLTKPMANYSNILSSVIKGK